MQIILGAGWLTAVDRLPSENRYYMLSDSITETPILKPLISFRH